MIYTLAFAPELNITADAPRPINGGNNKVEWSGVSVSGTAEKVCGLLDMSGCVNKRLFFTGGTAGTEIRRALADKDCKFFDAGTDSPLRVTVKSSKTTEFFQSPRALDGSALKPLLVCLQKLKNGDMLVIPERTSDLITDEMLGYVFSAVAAKEVRVLVRATAANVKNVLKYAPYCLFIDLADINDYSERKISADADIIRSMSLLQKKGAQSVIVFAANRLFATGDLGGIYRAESPSLPPDAESLAIARFSCLASGNAGFESALEDAVSAVINRAADTSERQKDKSRAGFTIIRRPVKKQVIRNVAHYVRENAAVSFEKKPLGILDIAVFSQLTMLDIAKLPGDSLTLREARKKYIEKNPDGYVDLGVVVPQTYPLLALCAESARFGPVEIEDRRSVIDDEKVVQFTAITFLLPTGEYCVAFNGTDDTIVGWKEDFYLLYDKPTESQRIAAGYLSRLAENTPDGAKIYVVGHSKGGNLAMYGAVNAGTKFREKLVAAYNFDGPGFTESFYKSAEFLSVRDKITSVIPQLSVVGRLFNHEENVMIVKSCFAGVYQHDLFSWETSGDAFVTVPRLDELSDKVQSKVNEIMFTLSARQRKIFVDGLFSLLYSTDSFTLTELMKNRGKLFGNFFKCDAETRKILLSMTMRLISDRYVREMILISLREAKKMQDKKEFEERSIVSGKIYNAIESIGFIWDGSSEDKKQEK